MPVEKSVQKKKPSRLIIYAGFSINYDKIVSDNDYIEKFNRQKVKKRIAEIDHLEE